MRIKGDIPSHTPMKEVPEVITSHTPMKEVPGGHLITYSHERGTRRSSHHILPWRRYPEVIPSHTTMNEVPGGHPITYQGGHPITYILVTIYLSYPITYILVTIYLSYPITYILVTIYLRHPLTVDSQLLTGVGDRDWYSLYSWEKIYFYKLFFY